LPIIIRLEFGHVPLCLVFSQISTKSLKYPAIMTG
jgi:hypothetical protein